MIQNNGRLMQHLKLASFLLLLLVALGLTACSQPVQGRPAPKVTPTWGVFYPTVVPFPTATGTSLSRPTGNKERCL